MENKTTIAVGVDRSLKNRILKFCNIRGLRLGKFAERALIRELEYEGGKDVLYSEDVPEVPYAALQEKPKEQL